MTFSFFTTMVLAAAFSLLYFFTAIIRTWLQTRWIKQNGTEAEAKILGIEVINERGCYLPFVKLQVAVMPAEGPHFIACVESFFPPAQVHRFTTNASLHIKYNPANISHLQIVTKQQSDKKQEIVKWQPMPPKDCLAMA